MLLEVAKLNWLEPLDYFLVRVKYDKESIKVNDNNITVTIPFNRINHVGDKVVNKVVNKVGNKVGNKIFFCNW